VARLCIRIQPNNHPTDAALNALRTQEGDVVCVVEDGHAFSPSELACGHYRILDLPGVDPADCNHLVEPVTDADEIMTRRRKVALNPALLKAGVWAERKTATLAQVTALLMARG